MTEGISRAEFDGWTRQIERNADAAAAQSALAVQVAEVIKDVTEVRSELREHRKEHETERAARASQRRWMIGLIVVLFAAVESPLVTLLITRH
jgi:hypothetical protein